MQEIKLTQGKVTQVDDEVYAELNQYKWQFDKGYATRSVIKDNKRKKIYMHRVITNTPEGMDTDHINGDKLYNLRANLRICTRSENMRNRGKQANNTSGYKGVIWEKQSHKWRAHIKINGRLRRIGCFPKIEDAAEAYKQAAAILHGKFAKQN